MALTMEYYDQLGESADRFRLDDMRALLDAEQKYKAHLDRKQALERAHEAELARLRQMRVQGVSDMFGNLAAATELFGKKGLIAYRVFATAQATIDTAKAAIGAYSSVVGIPYVGPVLAPIAAGAAVAAGAAQIARINGAFEIGGYTGDGGTSEVAGIVHRREFVIPANRVEEFGVPFFEAIRNGQMRPAPAAAASGSSSGSGVNVAFLNNRQDLNEWMATEGAKIAFDYHQRRAR
jgi:hypothetical protein